MLLIYDTHLLKKLKKNSKKLSYNVWEALNKKPHECGAPLLRFKNFSSSFVYDPKMHQMQLLNLYLVLYCFETHLLSYLSLTQHTIRLYFVLYFSYLNLPIITQTKNPTNVRLDRIYLIQINFVFLKRDILKSHFKFSPSLKGCICIQFITCI